MYKGTKRLEFGIQNASRSTAIVSALLASLLFSVGCGSGVHLGTGTSTSTRATLSGRAHGGQQPISGGAIQLYAAASGGAGSLATPLLSRPAITDANGNFDITGQYTCPSANTDVYLLASGGNPGLGSGQNNANLRLMVALGRCGDLLTTKYVEVNELTTVAATYALAPFMTSSLSVAAPPSHAQAMDTAFQMAGSIVSTSNGRPTGTSLNGAPVDVPKLLTLGNILSACVNTAGGAAGSPSACGQLFTLTSTGNAVSNTTDASLQIDFQPSVNVSSIFALNPSIAPFAPSLASAPIDWNFVGTTPGSPLSVSGALKPGLTGVSYNASLRAAGGSGSYAWNVSSGTLPAGLQLTAPRERSQVRLLFLGPPRSPWR